MYNIPQATAYNILWIISIAVGNTYTSATIRHEANKGCKRFENIFVGTIWTRIYKIHRFIIIPVRRTSDLERHNASNPYFTDTITVGIKKHK